MLGIIGKRMHIHKHGWKGGFELRTIQGCSLSSIKNNFQARFFLGFTNRGLFRCLIEFNMTTRRNPNMILVMKANQHFVLKNDEYLGNVVDLAWFGVDMRHSRKYDLLQTTLRATDRQKSPASGAFAFLSNRGASSGSRVRGSSRAPWPRSDGYARESRRTPGRLLRGYESHRPPDRNGCGGFSVHAG